MNDATDAATRDAARCRLVFDTIGEAIFLHDTDDGRILEVNRAAEEMFGYRRDELMQVGVGGISAGTPPWTVAEAQARLRAARAGTPQLFEWRAKARDGTLFWVEVKLRRATADGHDYLLAVVEHIGERKRMQEEADAHLRDLVALNRKLEDAHLQLLQSEKMASIGQLAAGVAHEINNPIGYISSNIGSLEKYLLDFFALLDAYERAATALGEDACADVRRLRDEIDIAYLRGDVVALLAETREGVSRVRKIVQDLKDFSRAGAEDEWHWADLRAGLDSTLNIVWNELKYKTTVVKEYGDLPPVWCLPSQINQVFMNLLVNSAQAIEQHGTVTLRAGTEAGMAWIEVADTGSGIAAENLKRIFDPFFTTKPVGKGTGLGLAVSYSIVRKHAGRIEVSSVPGQGTTFRVWLPIEPPPAQAAANERDA